MLETCMTGAGPWVAGFMRWPRISITFPEKYLGKYKVSIIDDVNKNIQEI